MFKITDVTAYVVPAKEVPFGDRKMKFKI